MRAQLKAISRTLVQEIEKTGTIVLDGQTFKKNSLNQSPYVGLCGPAVDKLASLAKDSIPESRIDKVPFITANEDAWKRSRHIVAEVTTKEGAYLVDPTINQYVPDAEMVYSSDDRYPMGYCPGSIIRSNIYNGLENGL